jgi:hypothetical protein
MGRVNTSLELCRPSQILVPLRCVEHANCTCRIAYRDRVLGVPNNLENMRIDILLQMQKPTVSQDVL